MGITSGILADIKTISYIWLPNEPLADANFIRCVDPDIIHIFFSFRPSRAKNLSCRFPTQKQDGESSWFNLRFCSLGNKERGTWITILLFRELGIRLYEVSTWALSPMVFPKLGAKGPPRRRLQFSQQPKKANNTQKAENQLLIFFFSFLENCFDLL